MTSSIQIGTITEIDNKKMMAIVVADGRSTDWLPVMATATQNKKHSLALKVKDQVLVLNPHGSNGDGFILTGLYHASLTPPKRAGDDKEVIEYADGTVIEFDFKKKSLVVESPSVISIACKRTTIKSETVTLDSSDINLGTGGKGVVTGATICPYTKAPHSGASATVKATL